MTREVEPEDEHEDRGEIQEEHHRKGHAASTPLIAVNCRAALGGWATVWTGTFRMVNAHF